MPPRYAYWTILIDDKPTAFRAREREELQPTLAQLQRKNTNVTLRWFARGKLWESREAEQADFQQQRRAALEPRDRRDRPAGAERRGSDWRPGGTHKDPRDRFKKKNRPERAWSEKDPATQRDRDKPGYKPPAHRSSFDSRGSDGGKPRPEWRDKPAGPPRGDHKPAPGGPGGKRPWTGKPRDTSGPPGGDRPWAGKPRGNRPWHDAPSPPNDRPWQTKPTGPRAQRKPWVGKPDATPGYTPGKPPGDRSWRDKPAGGPPRGDRPWTNKPAGGPPRGDRPWRDKAAGNPPRGDRPWTNKPAGGPPRGDRPWSSKPAGGPPRGDRPWRNKPADAPPRGDRPWNRNPNAPQGDRPGSTKPPAGGQRPWSGKPRDPNRKPFAPRGPGAPPRKRRDDEE
jgi:23S rRNA pseudouridine2605 synthase